MRRGRARRSAGWTVAAALAACLADAPVAAAETELAFGDLTGWSQERHADAFAVFKRSCAHLVASAVDPRSARLPSPHLIAACRAALALDPAPSDAHARAFFERRFRPRRVAATGLLTGYYEPELAASRTPGLGFGTPLLARPDDLVALSDGEPARSDLAGLAAARRRADGALEPFPDRAAIEDGALAGRGLEIAWVADPFDAFLAQVQGSVRLRFGDGSTLRLGYAGRNGYPYVSVGRALIDRGLLAREDADLPRIRAIFAADPALAREIMRLNRSFVFFRPLDLDPGEGPLGGQGVPLSAWRSIAIDRTLYAYGLPFFLSATMPDGTPLRRLAIAQDTGSAIVGAARVDLFAGSGAQAGTIAGVMRQPLDLVVLRPVETDAAP